MRRILEFRYNDTNDTIDVLYAGCKELDNYIHGQVEPKSRVWSKATSCWVITPNVIGNITAIGSPHFDEVKYFSLPPTIQNEVKKYLLGRRVTPEEDKVTPKGSPYAKLFLIEDSPMFLVKAAYKALARHYHPDMKTGDNERFLEITSAYKSLKK